MDKEQLKDAMRAYFESHPTTDETQIIQMVKTVKSEVWKDLVPPFQPMTVKLKTEIQTEYQESRTAFKRKTLRDESTEDVGEEVDEYADFNNNY